MREPDMEKLLVNTGITSWLTPRCGCHREGGVQCEREAGEGPFGGAANNTSPTWRDFLLSLPD